MLKVKPFRRTSAKRSLCTTLQIPLARFGTTLLDQLLEQEHPPVSTDIGTNQLKPFT